MEDNNNLQNSAEHDRQVKIVGLWEERTHIPEAARLTQYDKITGAFSMKESAASEQIPERYKQAVSDAISRTCNYVFKIVDEADTSKNDGLAAYQTAVNRLNKLREALSGHPMFGALLRHVAESQNLPELRERLTLLKQEVAELFGNQSLISRLEQAKKDVVHDKQLDTPGEKKNKGGTEL